MSITTLLTTLNGMYDEGTQTLVLDIVKLPGAGYATDKIEAMFKYFYDGATSLTVTGVLKPPVQGKQQNVLFTGAASALGQQQSRITFNFIIEGPALLLQMLVFLQYEWRFSETFKQLKNDDPLWGELSLLRQINPPDTLAPALVLVSDTYTDPERGAEFFFYINFYGILNWDWDLFSRVSWLLPMTNDTPAVGALQPVTPASSFGTVQNWAIEIAVASDKLPKFFGSTELDVAIKLVRRQSVAMPLAMSGLDVQARVTLSGTPLTLSAVMTTGASNLLRLAVDTNLPLPGPAELLTFFGDASAASSLPDQFKGGSGVYVSRVMFGVSVDQQKLIYSSLTLSALENRMLSVIPGLIEVGKIDFTFNVINPFDDHARRVNFTFLGELDLAGAHFDVSAQLPEYTVSATLADNEPPLSLSALANELLGPGVVEFELDITALRLSATPKPRIQYWAMCQIDSTLTLAVGPITFTLDRIVFVFNKTTAGRYGSLAATVEICGIAFDLSATSPRPAGDPDNSGRSARRAPGLHNRTLPTAPPALGPWVFAAGLAPGAVIPLGSIIGKFFSATGVPGFIDLSLNVVNLGGTVSHYQKDAGGYQRKAYTFSGDLKWSLPIPSHEDPLIIDAVVTIADDTGETPPKAGQAAGSATGNFDGMVSASFIDSAFFNAPITITYYMTKTAGVVNTLLSLTWNGVEVDYDLTTSVITFKLDNWTLGSIIEQLGNMIEPGKFKLDSPWSALNAISLDGLEVLFNTKNKKITVEYPLSSGINLGFINISKIGLIKSNQSVNIFFKGSPLFSGLPSSLFDPIQGNDIRLMPPVPGQGNEYFDLNYLGLGQHVALTPTEDITSVELATSYFMDAFGKSHTIPPIIPILPAPQPALHNHLLKFDQNSAWLIGSQFVVMRAIIVDVIFNDPDLYGLLIEIGGDNVPPVLQNFAGLKIEILYKKINDSVGEYAIQFQLPTYMRHIELGEVSLTLPDIAIDIFTNGDFKVDIGFPVGLDFSGSFAVQVFPFIGSGGFYFGKLSSVTAGALVPPTKYGTFQPVLVFGVGLSLGVGKDVSEGIFSAGLSLTAVGILEGVIGFFQAYDTNWTPDTNHYYKVSGTFGLVGRIYGSVNFAIISARVDIGAYVIIQIVIEAYNAIPISFQASVSVSIEIRINLGLFSIYIPLHFSITVSASFTIGNDNRPNAPWTKGPPSLIMPARFLPGKAYTAIKWQPLIRDSATRQRLTLYFLPAFTVRNTQGVADQTAQHVASFFIDSPDARRNNSTATSLSYLSKGVLAWSINALIHADQSGTTYEQFENSAVSVNDLHVLKCYLDDSAKTVTPIIYRNSVHPGFDIVTFIEHYFSGVSMQWMQAGDINAGAFPALPDLAMRLYYNSPQPTGEVDFNSPQNVGLAYQQAVQIQLASMAVNYQSSVESAADDNCALCRDVSDASQPPTDTQYSMSAFVFQDYFLMLAKSTVQDALDGFKSYRHPTSIANTLASIVATYTDTLDNPLQALDVIMANLDVALSPGTQLLLPGIVYQTRTGDSFDTVAALYNTQLRHYPIGAASAFDTGRNADLRGLIPAGVKIALQNLPVYTVLIGDTVTMIVKAIDKAEKAAGGTGAVSADQVFLAAHDAGVGSLLSLSLPTLTYVVGEVADGPQTLRSLIDMFGFAPARFAALTANLSAQGSGASGLFAAEDIAVPNLIYLSGKMILDGFDTVENVACISAMGSRFFLHGLRLPVPQDDSAIEGLYTLTGQEQVLPDLKQGDTYMVEITQSGNLPWLTFAHGAHALQLNSAPTLPVPFTPNDISRIASLRGIAIEPDISPQPPCALPLYQLSNPTFTLKAGLPWQYPDKLVLSQGTPSSDLTVPVGIWPFSDALTDSLQNHGPDMELVLKVASQADPASPVVRSDVDNYAFGTLVTIDVHQISGVGAVAGHICDVIGANDTGIIYLERLLAYVNRNGSGVIDQIQILFAPNLASGTPSGVQSASNGNVAIALVQANLSTETNPAYADVLKSFSLRSAGQNTLNSYQNFAALLWECSIVRSGGYYLFYTTLDKGDGLPENVFDSRGAGQVQILVTYKQNLSAGFVNCAVVAQKLDTQSATVYVEADALAAKTAIAAPGHVGFETIRAIPDTYTPVCPYPIPATAASEVQDRNYLQRQFNLLGFTLEDNDTFSGQPASLMPVGAVVPGETPREFRKIPDYALLGADWHYQTVIAVAKFAKHYVDPQLPGNYPAPAADPYGGLGGTAKLRLCWQDMYGNTMESAIAKPVDEVSVFVGYTDKVIGIGGWPSVSSAYHFPLVDGGAALQAGLFLDPTRYIASSKSGISADQAQKNAQVDSIIFMRVFYQLVQDDIVLACKTTLSGNPLAIDKTSLLQYVAGIYEYLLLIGNDQAATLAQPDFVCTWLIAADNMDNIFELTVGMQIARSANIDPDFADVDGVKQATTLLRPMTAQKFTHLSASTGDASKSVALSIFTVEFEATFKDRPLAGVVLKIATGPDIGDVTGGPGNQRVWVARFDPSGQYGMAITFDTAAGYRFFAPVPLATTLLNLPQVPINGYVSGQSYPASLGFTDFDNVNLDAWGQQCLDAVEAFLSPQYAVPAFLLDAGLTLQTLLSVKQNIADAIEGTITAIIVGEKQPAFNLGNAQDKLKQQYLKQLSNVYRIDAAVQGRVNVKSQFKGSNNVPALKQPYSPGLFGQMVGQAPTPKASPQARLADDEALSTEYALSSSKLPVGNGDSWITFLFEAKDAQKNRSFRFDAINFAASHIEHQICDVPHMGEYKASTWLTFVVPFAPDAFPLGAVEIPVPLRAYPIPPSVTGQSQIYDGGGNIGETTITGAKAWAYCYTYKQTDAPQDFINTQLELNTPDAGAGRRGRRLGDTEPRNLPEALAQFNTVYTAIQADFAKYLTQVTVSTAKTDPVYVNTMYAVNAFVTILNKVATLWGQWNQINPRGKKIPAPHPDGFAPLPGPGPAYQIDAYTLNEAPVHDGSADLATTIIATDKQSALAMPDVDVHGYLPEPLPSQPNSYCFYTEAHGDKVYLKYADRSAHARVLTFSGLDILAHQSAWSGVYVTRNKNLILRPDGTSWEITDRHFIYKTPLVKFYNKWVPLLVCGELIDVAKANQSGSRVRKSLPLPLHLFNLFSELLGPLGTEKLFLKIECTYEYLLDGKMSFDPISLPVAMAAPFGFEAATDLRIGETDAYCPLGNKGFVCKLSLDLKAWFKKNEPSVKSSAFRFDLSLYSASDNKLPLMTLSRLMLLVEDITDLA